MPMNPATQPPGAGEFDQDGLHADAEQDENKVRVDQQLQQLLDEAHCQVLGHCAGGVQRARSICHLDSVSVQLVEQVGQVIGDEIHQVCVQGFGG